MLCLIVISVICVQVAEAARDGVVDITPIPMEFLNPRLTEFRRIDSNNDNALTFSEFLLSDRPFVESQSRYFHDLDSDGNGLVTRNEFEKYFKKRDDEHHRQRIQTDQFFKNLALSPFDGVAINRNLFGFGPNPPSSKHIIIQTLTGEPGQQPTQQQQNESQ